MEDAKLVLSTVDSEPQAVEIITQLVERELIACGNIIPGARSIYKWQGKIEDTKELVLIMKTTNAKLKELEARFLELHPYDTAEFVTLDPQYISEKYLDWIKGCLN